MLYLHYEKSHSILIEMDTTKSSVPKDVVIRFSGDSPASADWIVDKQTSHKQTNF